MSVRGIQSHACAPSPSAVAAWARTGPLDVGTGRRFLLKRAAESSQSPALRNLQNQAGFLQLRPVQQSNLLAGGVGISQLLFLLSWCRVAAVPLPAPRGILQPRVRSWLTSVRFFC